MVGFSRKWYDFSKSGTTFWWEQPIHGCVQLSRYRISHSRMWDSHSFQYISHFFWGCINNDRVRVYRARASSFQKISFTFTSKAGNAVYKGFPPISTRNALSNYLHPSFTFCIGEGSMKVPHTFALAGNAREPLFIEHFGISGEGEGYFLCCKVMASTRLVSSPLWILPQPAPDACRLASPLLLSLSCGCGRAWCRLSRYLPFYRSAESSLSPRCRWPFRVLSILRELPVVVWA